MAIGNPYVPVTITGYNATPPTDDGQQTEGNTVLWAKHKDKLGDPIKTGVDSTQTAITAALDKRLLNSIDSKTGNYTVVEADRGKILNFTGTSISTFTLLAAATAKVGFELVIRNFGTAVLTVDGNAAETVDGVASIDLYPGQAIFLQCDGTNWVVAQKFLKPGVLAKTNSDSPYSVLLDDDGRVIDVDASAGDVTITLPTVATARNGFSVTVKKTDSSANIVTIDGNGTETVDGSLTKVIAAQFTALTVVCDGTEWFLTQGAASGGLVKVATATASASATIEFSGLSTTYDHYILDIINLLPATDDVELWIRLSDDNGSTFKSGASDYRSGTATILTADHIQASASGAGASLSNVASDYYNAVIEIWNPAGSGKTYVLCAYQYIRADASAMVTVLRSGWYDTAVATDAIQFLMESGNIAEGQFNLYGVAK